MYSGIAPRGPEMRPMNLSPNRGTVLRRRPTKVYDSPSPQIQKSDSKPRNYFPETWLWQLFNLELV